MNEKICNGDPCLSAQVLLEMRQTVTKAIGNITQSALRIADAEVILQGSDAAHTVDGQFEAIAATDERNSALKSVEILEDTLRSTQEDMDRCRTCIGLGNCALSS